MAGNVINKMMGLLGLDDDDAEMEEIEVEEKEDNEEEPEKVESIFTSKKQQNKVVNIHTASTAKIVIIKPRDYDEAANICDDLKNRRIIVVNTSGLEPKIAQRLLDFVGGASYVLGGEIQEVEKGIYIVSPSNVEVTNDLKSELSNKGILSWGK